MGIQDPAEPDVKKCSFRLRILYLWVRQMSTRNFMTKNLLKGATEDLENTILTRSNKHDFFTLTDLIPLVLYIS